MDVVPMIAPFPLRPAVPSGQENWSGLRSF